MIRLMPFLALAGCVSAPVAPNLTIPPIPPSCPKIALPAIPQKARLVIDGDKVDMDEGGWTILQGYVRARSVLR